MSYLFLRRFSRSSLFCLLPALAVGALAQDRVEPWKAPHFSIDPKALYQAASVVASADNAEVAILEDDESYSFDESGRSIHTQYVVYKVLNQKGADSWDAVSVDWEPWHEARPRPTAPPSSWTRTTTAHRAIWPSCWSTIP